MKKSLSLLILIAFMLSGCGSTPNSSNNNQSNNTTTPLNPSSGEGTPSNNGEETKYSKGLEFHGEEVVGIGTCKDKDIVIPLTCDVGFVKDNPVTGIGESAFQNTDITSITIHSNIKTIRNDAFNGCKNLTYIEIPATVKEIGRGTFGNCTSLHTVIFEEGSEITILGKSNGFTNGPDGYLFDNCTSLTSVTLPKTITSISEGTFEGCTSLPTVTIPSNVTSIEKRSFLDCSSMSSIVIPKNVVSIGDGSFSGCESLEAFNYEGTIEELKNIKSVGDSYAKWNYGCPARVVHCSDGDYFFQTCIGGGKIYMKNETSWYYLEYRSFSESKNSMGIEYDHDSLVCFDISDCSDLSEVPYLSQLNYEIYVREGSPFNNIDNLDGIFDGNWILNTKKSLSATQLDTSVVLNINGSTATFTNNGEVTNTFTNIEMTKPKVYPY